MSWIAETGPVLVGLGGLAFGAWQAQQRLTHDRTIVDLASARDVCEDGAIYLHRVAYALDPAKQDIIGRASESYVEMSELGKRYDEVSERMKVRLGPDHNVTRPFVGAGEAALDATRALERIVKLHLPQMESGNELAAKQVEPLVDRDEQVVTNARSRFDAHRSQFIEAASRSFGTKRASA